MNKLCNVLMEDARFLGMRHGEKIEKGAKILITGASGLIGINLLAFLLSPEVMEMGVDIYLARSSSKGKEFIDAVFEDNQFVYLDVDLTSPDSLPSGVKFDYIFHLATYGQPGRFIAEGRKTMELNSIGLIKLFHLLSPRGRLFFSSSSEVYSGNVNVPHVESEIGNTNTTHPRACYIEAKRFGEAYCYLQASAGIRAYSGRISLAYGPGFQFGDQRVINEFIMSAVINGRISMRDAGAAVRVYCYVSDTIDMILTLLSSQHFHPINIGGVSKISVYELAVEVGRLSGASVFPGPETNSLVGAPQIVYGSQIHAQAILDKSSYVPIEEGIERSLKWARALRQSV